MKLQILIDLFILAATLYLIFFKSYLTEKGKSAALKEDLNEITREVESIKHEFSREHEILKTDFQRILNYEVSYRSEERNALIQFHGTISEWLYSILEVSYSTYGRTSLDSLLSVRKSISSYYAKAGIAKSKVELLVEDKELIDRSQKLYSETLTFHHWTDSKFLELQLNLESQKSSVDQFLILFKNFEEKNRALAQEMAEEEKKLKEKATALTKEYYETRKTEYLKIKSIEESFTSLVKTYLKN